jgi:hypothetical protein
MRELMGLNVHTVLFKPELYRSVCNLIRDYHGFDWDVGAETEYAPGFPMARNGVDWLALYGGWKKLGYTTDVSVMFGQTPPAKWKDLPRDAFAYGKAFASYFGPSGPQKLVDSVEIGNEPENFDDAQYRTLFENMARGVRAGDPRLKIVTCAVTPGPSERYAKSLGSLKGLEALYDVVNLHTYAFAEQYPTWRRSFPEDPTTGYLKVVRDTLAWRDANAPSTEVWITEFGWDASTKPAPPTGDFSRWEDVSDERQAQYLVRSFLLFSAMDVARAYVYFFNDKDEPQLHGSSGLTRNYVPKPAFHAVAHLYRTLGELRFRRKVVEESGKLYVFEYAHGSDPSRRVWAAWSPTGSGREVEAVLPAPGGKVLSAERMPLTAGAPEAVPWTVLRGGKVALKIGEAPVFVRLGQPSAEQGTVWKGWPRPAGCRSSRDSGNHARPTCGVRSGGAAPSRWSGWAPGWW